MSASITRDNRIAKILKDLANFYKEEPRKLVYYLRSQGYSNRKIASILDISVQALLSKYPLHPEEVNRG